MLNMRSIKYDMKKEEKHNNLLNLSETCYQFERITYKKWSSERTKVVEQETFLKYNKLSKMDSRHPVACWRY